MSFRRFMQRDILGKCSDQFEVVRLLGIIVSNIHTFPENEKYHKVRMVNIKSISISDKDLLTEILVFSGFRKQVKDLEEFMILVNLSRLPEQKDIDFIFKEIQHLRRAAIVDNTEIVARFVNDTKQETEMIIKQFHEDRETVNANWKRTYLKLRRT